ncbi:MAG: acyl-CoA dehydrogenase family protein [Kiritimatiellia bacterium]
MNPTLEPPEEEETMSDRPTMKMLPGDEVRQIMWRFTDRFDIQMAVMGARSVARGLVARLVANGQRNTHEWTPEKNSMYEAFDQAGITAAGLDPEFGGTIEGPRNLALSLLAWELAWVDAGSATTSLVNNLAMGPISEKGTPEQRAKYMSRCNPANGEKIWRGAFALTEPLPYVGVDTGVLCGKVRIAQWNEGEEPWLQVEKRGRFITNMMTANFITAAVDTDDPRIASSCMVILEETDEGLYDRGAPTLKMVHQLSNTHDPIFNLKVPASRIVGGYTIKDGKIVPNLTHSEIIEAVFGRTRIGVGLMTAAKLVSAVEPVIRYQRGRFRGAAGVEPGSPRYDLGLQNKEDALQRLADVWATGEAAASLGFAAARAFDALEAVEKPVLKTFADQGISGRALLKALKEPTAQAVQLIEQGGDLESADPVVQYVHRHALANVLCPACKLWNTGHGANLMREAVSLMGGYGITEDCPGFLGQKWMDAQLEATYEGPEVVQRRQLTVMKDNPVFQALLRKWVEELRDERPELSAALDLWLWTNTTLSTLKDANGKRLGNGQRHGVAYPLVDALSWLLAAKCFRDDVRELAAKGPEHPLVGPETEGYVNTFSDLLALQSAAAAGETVRICSELYFGYQTQLPDTSAFRLLRDKVECALLGDRLAKDRAAASLSTIMIPEALDYPQA